MANYTIKKRVLMRGDKGDTGGGGIDTTVPQAGIIAYKGDTIPEGYILYSEVPDGVLTHITATYTQTATITDASSLDDLRPDLVVKAYYYDAETGITSDYVITDYTLSGTLEVGTSTITASYKGFSDSFDVTVEESITYLYKWDFTQSLTDSVQGVTATLGNCSQSSAGIYFNKNNAIITLLDSFNINGKTIEVDISSMSKIGNNTDRYVLCTTTGSGNYGLYFDTPNTRWVCYNNGVRPYTQTSNDANVFSGKTAKYVINNIDNDIKVYANDALIYDGYGWNINNTQLKIGSGSWGTSFFYMTITGVRIYANQ